MNGGAPGALHRLALSYVALRFIHFAALMLLFGNALYSVWFAPSSLQRS